MKPQDIQDLKILVEFLKEHGVAEFDLDRGDLKIRLKFHEAPGSAAGLSSLADALRTAQAAPPLPAAPIAPAAAAAAPPAPEADPDAGLHIVKSPIVGTYYGSPSPGAGAFVAPGDRVQK